MDRLTAFVAIAHLKLRLSRVTPEFVEMATTPTAPVLPAPVQLAGLKSRLQRAKGLEARAAAAGTRVDNALDVIETGVSALEKHAPRLEQYGGDLMDTINSLLEGGNGGPPLDAIEESPTQPAAAPAAPAGPNGGPRILNSSGAQ